MPLVTSDFKILEAIDESYPSKSLKSVYHWVASNYFKEFKLKNQDLKGKITFEKALQLAIEKAKTIYNQSEILIDEAETIHTPFGWFFEFGTKKYLETNKTSDNKYKMGLIIINRATGEVRYEKHDGKENYEIIRKYNRE